ncbi:MAG: hypothetical protein IJ600_08135, partial [Lachnospiraceae bacterium]|nr:hypothetical protein [Lachnospiraceae bacterium]
MKGRRLVNRIISGTMAFIMAASTLMVTPIRTHADEPVVMDAASAVNYATILGRATDFGIVAATFHQNNHMETTFAAKKFVNDNIPNEVDFLPSDFTAQFLVGEIPEGSKFCLGGKQTAGVYNVEADPDKVVGDFTYPWMDINYNWKYSGEYGKFHIHHDFKAGGQTFSVVPRSDVNSNIQAIIDNAKDRSDKLISRASNYNYVIPDEAYSNNAVTIDLTDAEYEGKVVYINVDSKLAERFSIQGDTNPTGQGVHIKKRSSTVVVFNYAQNFTDNISKLDAAGKPSEETAKGNRICKFVVSTDNGATWYDTKTDSGDDPNVLIKKDQEINQKIIFNVTANGPVELNTVGGTLLVPGTNDVNITGSSTGWLVAGGKAANNSAEWHYIYRGGNQEYSKDGAGQIHFASRKTFTNLYNKKDTKENTTISSEQGKYSFNWYETNSSYNTSGITPTVVSNQATNTIKFPTLSFYSDTVKTEYSANNIFSTQDKQFEGSNYKQGTFNDGGKLLQVLKEDPKYLKIYIAYNDYYEGDRSDLQIVATYEGGYEKLDAISVPSSHDGKYTITGEELIEKLNAKNVDVDNLTGISFNGYNGLQFTDGGCVYSYRNITRYSDISSKYYVPVGESKDYYYVVTEVGAGEASTSNANVINSKGKITVHLKVTNDNGVFHYTVDSQTTLDDGQVYKNNSAVNMSGVEFNLGAFFNLVKNGTSVDLSKTNVGGEELAGAALKITNSNTSYTFAADQLLLGEGAKDVVVNGNSISYTSGTAKSTLTGLPDGTYTLHEDTAPAGYEVASDIIFKIENGAVTVTDQEGKNITTETDSSTGRVIIKMEDESSAAVGKLTIEKTVSGGGTAATEKTYNFTVTGPNAYSQTVTINGNGSKTLTDLTPG